MPASAASTTKVDSLTGVAFAVALWHLASPLSGDALFHLARVRKLDAFGSLSLRTVDEFKDGGLHPGYAFFASAAAQFDVAPIERNPYDAAP